MLMGVEYNLDLRYKSNRCLVCQLRRDTEGVETLTTVESDVSI
jgi:hypothetical protein